jgi:hypothetical protein
MGDGSFGAGVAVDSKMAATFMLKALGYEVADYATVETEAAAVGIEIAESAGMTRGEGFAAMWQTVNLPKQGSDVALGVELGKLEPETTPVADITVELDSVVAVGNTVIDVTFDDDVDAVAAADADAYTITVKGGTTELEVKEAVVFGDDRVLLYTAAQKAGTAYTLTVGEYAKNFSGLAKSSDEAEINTVKGTDTGIVEVEFKANIDKATAEDIANYSIDRVGTVVGAELDEDLMTVILTVEGFEKVQGAKLTVENVLSIDGVEMDKTTKTFYAKFDKDAPELDDDVEVISNTEIELYFDDEHGVDEATAEDVANYEIDGLEVLEAEAAKKDRNGDATDYFTRVTLTTSEQEKGDKYDVKVLYMVDGSTAMNATEEALEADFRGEAADKDEPEITDASVDALSLELFEITFDEKVDPATVTDLANYTVQKDEFEILDVIFKDNDTDSKTIQIITEELEVDETYRVYVNNIADLNGNAMEDEVTVKISTDGLLTDAPTYVADVVVVDEETLTVTFEHAVTEATMEDPTNYVVEDFGAALSAELVDGSDNKEVTVKFNEMDGNETYNLVVNGVETFSGYAMEDSEYAFIVTSDDVDTTQPTVDSVENVNDGMIIVEFDEEVEYDTTANATYLKLARATEADDDDANTNKYFYAYAVAVTGEDDTQIAFNILAADEDSIGGTDVDLEAAARVKYYINEIVGVTDLAGNTPDYDAEDEQFYTSSATTSEFEAPEYDDVDQTSVTLITVEYDEDLLLGSADLDILDQSDDSVIVTVANADLDEDMGVIEITLAAGAIDDDTDIYFNLQGIVTDLLGRDVADEDIEINGWDNNDETKPEILDVVAVDNRTIEVYYDESMDTPGTYDIYEEDGTTMFEDDFYKVEVDADDDSMVVLVLKEEMNNDDFYTLKQSTKAKDLSGNRAEDANDGDGIEFLGSSKHHVVNVIDGVVFVNAKVIEIKDNVALPSGDYIVESNGAAIITVAYDEVLETAAVSGSVAATAERVSSKVLRITITSDLDAMHDGQTYTVDINPDSAVASATGSAVNENETPGFEESFTGVAEKLDLTVDSATQLTVDDLDVDDADHIVSVYDGATLVETFEGETDFENIDDEVITIASHTFSGTATVVVTDVNSGLVLKIAR